jgi:hypothetical protein
LGEAEGGGDAAARSPRARSGWNKELKIRKEGSARDENEMMDILLLLHLQYMSLDMMNSDDDETGRETDTPAFFFSFFLSFIYLYYSCSFHLRIFSSCFFSYIQFITSE